MRALTRRQQLLRQARRQPEVVVDQLLAVEQQVQDLLAKVRQLEDRQALEDHPNPRLSASRRKKRGRACPQGFRFPRDCSKSTP